MHNIKNLIVGCGFSGATMARKIAEDFGEEVLVIDAKNHIGGNSYDYYDKNNICIHKYGTHIFHTNLEHVWKYLSRFTRWHPYMHEVKGKIDGQEVPIPFNLNSIRKVFRSRLPTSLRTSLSKSSVLTSRCRFWNCARPMTKILNFWPNMFIRRFFSAIRLSNGE